MTATATSRNTLQLLGLAELPVELTVKNDEVLYAGAMLAVDATPEAVNAADTSGLKVVGRCPEALDNKDDGLTVNPEMGCFKWANDGSNPVVAGDIVAYVKDNQTVCASAGSTNKVVAGLVISVDTDGVWMCQTLEGLKAAQALHDLGTASAGAHIADVATVTQESLILTSMSGSAGVTMAAETNLDALTLTSMLGTANTTPVAETNMHAIAVNSVGTPSTTTMETVTQAGNTGSADLSPVQNNFATLATELAAQRSLNVVLINDVKLYAEQLVKQKALNTVLINDVKSLATELNAARVDNAAQVTKINAILTALEAQEIVKTA
jgi:hypothetical protein